ncbi:hypothetical protein [Motiliproteus sp. MSK22-1]|uniref:hypothetical protein n=1 Tax=Motiliproteus sp. MSK22-1 TaxID=1897630 RepID=UPI0009778ACA|nr:hypothetical protein [Motiliproteus sp. MSK22-1]OMH38015.1 hypothetical protein BGP75_06945 [Motiliproteus sp. MSK22-1]
MSISFEFSKEPALLEQYYNIREECFRRELGIQSFDGGENDFDRWGRILIVRDGDRCIGGARLSGSTPYSPGLLPLENNGFMVLKVFSKLALEGKSYCQWTRLALLPEYRSMENLQALALSMIQNARACGYSYAFSVAGSNRSRLYRKIYKVLDYDYEIRTDLSVPAEQGFMGLEHLLSIGYLEEPISAKKSLESLVANISSVPCDYLRKVA